MYGEMAGIGAAGAANIAASVMPAGALGKGAATVAGGSASTTLYRAVSHAERAEVIATNSYRSAASAMEGKWFAETLSHAMEWGYKMQGAGNFRVVATSVSKTFADTMFRLPRLDGIGPARYAADLSKLNQTIRWVRTVF